LWIFWRHGDICGPDPGPIFGQFVRKKPFKWEETLIMTDVKPNFPIKIHRITKTVTQDPLISEEPELEDEIVIPQVRITIS
jgi:hypothetical protein